MKNDLDFKIINLEKDYEVCLKFRADSYKCSFGNESYFWESDGLGGQRYLDWMKSKNSRYFKSIHLFKGKEIIGQLEIEYNPKDLRYGYVYLFYLSSEYRGSGYSSLLNQYTLDFFKTNGVSKARLSVSPLNQRAIRFYKKNGWKEIGPKEGSNPIVHIMEVIF